MKKSVWIFLLAVLLPSVVLGWLALRSAEEQQIVFERRTAELYQKETEALAVTVRDTVEAERRVFGETVRRLLAKSDADALALDFTNTLADAWPVKAVGFAINKEGKLVSPSVAMAAKQPEMQRFLLGNGSFLMSCEPALVYNWGGDNSVRGKFGNSQMKQSLGNITNSGSFSSASHAALKDSEGTPVAVPNLLPAPSNQQGGEGRIALGATLQEDVLVRDFRAGIGGVVSGGTSGNSPSAAPALQAEMQKRDRGDLRKESEHAAPGPAPASAPPPAGAAPAPAAAKPTATAAKRAEPERKDEMPAKPDAPMIAPISPGTTASRARGNELAKAMTKADLADGIEVRKGGADKEAAGSVGASSFDAAKNQAGKKMADAKPAESMRSLRPQKMEMPEPRPIAAKSKSAPQPIAVTELAPELAPIPQTAAAAQPQGGATLSVEALQMKSGAGTLTGDQPSAVANGTLANASGGMVTLNNNAINRLVEPQQLLNAPGAALSTVVPETAEFRTLTEESDDGMVARFAQDKLNLIFWLRPPEAPEMIFGCLVEAGHFSDVWKDVLERHRSSPRDSFRGAESQPEFVLALLDDRGKPVATRPASASTRDWKHPFVASEIGEALPHWEAALDLASPTALADSARGLWRTLAFTIAGAVALIAFGGWLVVADARRQLALAQQKTDFVSNVSHELKTPLTSIRMFAELMHDRPQPPEKQGQYLRIITVEAERLTRLINNVLDFAKIGRKQKRTEKKPLDLHALVARVWESQELHLREAGFSTRWEAAPGPYPVLGDDDALAQVLVNLLSNAEKYSNGKKEVELHSWLDDAYVNIAVMDRGMGVPNGDDRKIFEAFYRAHDSLASGIQGSGLGLTLAQRIVHEHGGEIRFERREGGGCRFTLRVPLAKPSES